VNSNRACTIASATVGCQVSETTAQPPSQ
jgi:hypothetical protein